MVSAFESNNLCISSAEKNSGLWGNTDDQWRILPWQNYVNRQANWIRIRLWSRLSLWGLNTSCLHIVPPFPMFDCFLLDQRLYVNRTFNFWSNFAVIFDRFTPVEVIITNWLIKLRASGKFNKKTKSKPTKVSWFPHFLPCKRTSRKYITI